MIRPHPNFRPNPARAVYVQGEIDQALIYRLTPQIIRLQHQSRAPITVYIDSPGAVIQKSEQLWRLLTASDQNLAPACRIITVVTSRAASAAADLLSSGDYAIAHPQSTILYHGSRISRGDITLTVEMTSALAHWLRITNETYAMELIRKIESRFMFRFLLSQPYFDGIRKNNPGTTMTDTECFLSLISGSLSERAKRVFATARDRQGRYDALLNAVKKSKKYKKVAKTEASRLKAIVDFELAENGKNKNWTFQNQGLTRLNDDFFLLNEHLAIAENDRFNRLCTQWGRFSLTQAEQDEIDKVDEASRNQKLISKVRPLLEPLWTFFVALCHAVQEGENELTATDAFWLGLIDEVMGAKDLHPFRAIAEYEKDPPPEQKELPGTPEGPGQPSTNEEKAKAAEKVEPPAGSQARPAQN